MMFSAIRVVLITQDSSVASQIQTALAGKEIFVSVIWKLSFNSALDFIAQHSVDLVLIDLTLADGAGLDSFNKIITLTPGVVLIVLSDGADEDLITAALKHGAQDLIAKDHLDSYWLPRVLIYFMERNITRAVLRDGEECGAVNDGQALRKIMHTIVRASEENRFEHQERAQHTLNSIGDAVLTTNLIGRVTYLNTMAEAMTGWSLRDAVGLPLETVFSLIDADTRQILPSQISSELKIKKNARLPNNSLLMQRNGGEISIEDSVAPICNQFGEISGAVIVFRDVSDARAMAKKIMHMAQHDTLTGLANRTLLSERLARALGLTKRSQKKIALLFIDIDNFKTINDKYGHAFGDKLLQVVARRLESLVRVTDTVCRQGGDEFVVLLTQIEHSQDAAQVAEKMIASFAGAQIIHDRPVLVTLSIGISLYPNDGSNIEQLFQRADSAMYRAKMSGRNNYQFYSGALDLTRPVKMNTELSRVSVNPSS